MLAQRDLMQVPMAICKVRMHIAVGIRAVRDAKSRIATAITDNYTDLIYHRRLV
jgi:hypothetical protein